MKSWPPSASPPSAFGRAATRGTPRRSRRSVPPRRGGPRGAPPARTSTPRARAHGGASEPAPRNRRDDRRPVDESPPRRTAGIRSVRRGRRSRPRATGSTPRSRSRFARRTFGRRRIPNRGAARALPPRGRHAVDPHDGDDARGDAGARVRRAPRVGPRAGLAARAPARARGVPVASPPRPGPTPSPPRGGDARGGAGATSARDAASSSSRSRARRATRARTPSGGSRSSA